MIRLASFAAVVLASLALPASGQVFKCVDKAGKTVYQDGPCDGSIPRPVPAPAPAKPNADTPPAGGGWDSLSQEDSGLALFLLFYTHCTRAFPDLHAKSAMNYQAWRLKNAAAVQRIEANAAFQANLNKARDDAAKTLANPQERSRVHGQCNEMVLQAFEPPPTHVAKSPTEAWNGYMAAVKAGDIQKALGYMMPGSRGRYRQVLEALGPDGLRNAAATFGELKTDMQVKGDIAFGYLVRRMPDGKDHAFEISFMRDPRSGGWFIESM